MQTCNISKSPKEYTHLGARKEPNRILFFLGWIWPSKIQINCVALSGLNFCYVWFLRFLLEEVPFLTCPFKTWHWETSKSIDKLETTTKTPTSLNHQYFNSWEFQVSPRAVDDITNVGSHIPCIPYCHWGVYDVIFSHKGKPQHPEGLNLGLGR